MGRKNRGYKKGEPFRDYKKFVIIAEGEREDAYFLEFNVISSRVRVVIVEREEGKSAVKHFLDRAQTYSDKYELLPEDFLWFVLDVDRWPREQIENLNIACEQSENWQVAISNPCFEVWLYYHFKNEIPAELNVCKKLKTAVSKLNYGGYNPHVYAMRIADATKNAEKKDRNKLQFYPAVGNTKIYNLAAQMLEFIGKKYIK